MSTLVFGCLGSVGKDLTIILRTAQGCGDEALIYVNIKEAVCFLKGQSSSSICFVCEKSVVCCHQRQCEFLRN
jgi:hypothetical protein